MKWIAKTGSLLVSVGIGVYLILALAFTSEQMDGQRVSSIEVRVKDARVVDFVDHDMVVQALVSQSIRITNEPIDSINKSQVRDIVQNIPYVRQAEVYFTPDGIFHIQVSQRIPLMRIRAGSDDYYVDEDTVAFPVSPRYSHPVPVFTGRISDGLIGGALMPMALYFSQNTFWAALIDQVQVWSPSEIELVPKVGRHRIYLGDASDLDWKLTKLKALYEHALPVVGWDHYRSIDLRYSNQVVCQKRNES